MYVAPSADRQDRPSLKSFTLFLPFWASKKVRKVRKKVLGSPNYYVVLRGGGVRTNSKSVRKQAVYVYVRKYVVFYVELVLSPT